MHINAIIYIRAWSIYTDRDVNMCVTIVCRVDNSASQDKAALGTSVCLGSYVPMAVNSKSYIISRYWNLDPNLPYAQQVLHYTDGSFAGPIFILVRHANLPQMTLNSLYNLDRN